MYNIFQKIIYIKHYNIIQASHRQLTSFLKYVIRQILPCFSHSLEALRVCLSLSQLFLRMAMFLHLLLPIFVLPSACPTRSSHFSINENAGLQDFWNNPLKKG